MDKSIIVLDVYKRQLEESARKFKSAENYQASGEYFKAYSLYQKVIEDDSNYCLLYTSRTIKYFAENC